MNLRFANNEKGAPPAKVEDPHASTTSVRELSDEVIKAAESARSLARQSTSRELSDAVIKAAESSRGLARHSTSSLAQLRLASMKLHGREDDLSLLKAKLRELAATKGVARDDCRLPEIILVSGISGSGKTALISRGLQDPAKKMGMAFAGGKFDLLNQASLPLSAFAEAMTSLANYVATHENATNIKVELGDAFGEEDALLLSRAMPGLEALLGIEMDKGENASVASASTRMLAGTMQTGKEMIARQQYAIKRLLKIVCSHLDGLVLFIDDLQWADIATLDLLKSISLDDSIPSLLLVGAYRQDEVSESHPLALQIREKEQIGISMTTIKIGNLRPDHVRSLVAEALGMEGDEDRVGALATTVHNKTEGNAFFVVMFLRSLYDEQLLQYNFGLMSWIWDDEAVKHKLVTENVATLMVSKLKRLKKTSQNVIKIASCLGASFSAPVLALVHETMADASDEETDSLSTVSLSAREFEDEGLWERDSVEICRFSHDKVQSAAFELIPPDRRNSFRREIGDALTKKLDPQSLDRMLLEVVSLRNCSVPSSTEERKALAGLNLEAGMRASSNAAFDTAVVYFRAGRKLLGANAWVEDQDTMVALCSEEANACFVLGDLDQMDSLIGDVLSKDISIEAKFRCYEVKILALNTAGKFKESIDTALDFRRQLGLPAPKNKPASIVTVLAAFIKTNRALGARTAEDIASLPPLEDERIIMGQRMLELLFTSTYQAQQTIYPLIAFLLVRASLKHGINTSSVDGFANFGLLLCGAFGQLKRGRDMAKAVELLLENPENRRMESRACFIPQSLILHWTLPLQGTLTPLLNGYQTGLEIGDIESAGYCLVNRSFLLFYAARNLEGLEQELETNVNVIRQMNQSGYQFYMAAIALVTVKKLRGRPSFRFNGEEMNFSSIYRVADDTGSTLLRAFANIAELELLAIGQDWDAALSFLAECGDLRPLVPGFYHGVRFTFLESLIYFKASQMATGWLQKRKFKRKACKSMALISGWLKKGNVNVVHVRHLLAAERHALEGNVTKAEEEYKAAIAVSAKNGFLQDRARKATNIGPTTTWNALRKSTVIGAPRFSWDKR